MSCMRWPLIVSTEHIELFVKSDNALLLFDYNFSVYKKTIVICIAFIIKTVFIQTFLSCLLDYQLSVNFNTNLTILIY